MRVLKPMLMALATAGMLLSGGCGFEKLGSIGNSDGACSAGEACRCDGIGNCDRTCAGGSCAFECTGTGNCDFSCEGGSCTTSCEGTSNCETECPGGSCATTCENTGNCILSDCSGGNCSIERTMGTGNTICRSGCDDGSTADAGTADTN